MKKHRPSARPLLVVLFLVVIGYGVIRLWDINHHYVQEQRVRARMDAYKPTLTDTTQSTGEDADEIPIVNQSVVDARANINTDIVGWISLDNTSIDYPFVQAADNDYYLRRDIFGQFANAGTIFMDSRCAADFSDFVTVLYGHNMRNGSMFADIKYFENDAFFESHDTGWLYLENATYKLAIFAYLTVRGDDYLYGLRNMDDIERRSFLADIQARAHRYRDSAAAETDRLVVLSTCTSTARELRRVIIARLVAI